MAYTFTDKKRIDQLKTIFFSLRTKLFCNNLSLVVSMHALLSMNTLCPLFVIGPLQGGITCGAIDEPRKSSKAIDERVIINFRNKNVVIERFRDKNVVIARFCDKNVVIARFRDKNVIIARFRDKNVVIGWEYYPLKSA